VDANFVKFIDITAELTSGHLSGCHESLPLFKPKARDAGKVAAGIMMVFPA
jgi:hypothetical protein